MLWPLEDSEARNSGLSAVSEPPQCALMPGPGPNRSPTSRTKTRASSSTPHLDASLSLIFRGLRMSNVFTAICIHVRVTSGVRYYSWFDDVQAGNQRALTPPEGVPGCMPGISIHCRRHRTRTVTWVVAQPRRLRHHGWSMVYDTIFQTDTQTILPSGAYFQQ